MGRVLDENASKQAKAQKVKGYSVRFGRHACCRRLAHEKSLLVNVSIQSPLDHAAESPRALHFATLRAWNTKLQILPSLRRLVSVEHSSGSGTYR